jgi:hypothetical protein
MAGKASERFVWAVNAPEVRQADRLLVDPGRAVLEAIALEDADLGGPRPASRRPDEKRGRERDTGARID